MTARLCACGHLEAGHDLGTRRGVTVRTRCLHADGSGPCQCKAFAAAEAVSA